MRLELALIVGILFFCSWCAYIVARMNSSVNVPPPGSGAPPPPLGVNLSLASNESHALIGHASAQQQARHFGASEPSGAQRFQTGQHARWLLASAPYAVQSAVASEDNHQHANQLPQRQRVQQQQQQQQQQWQPYALPAASYAASSQPLLDYASQPAASGAQLGLVLDDANTEEQPEEGEAETEGEGGAHAASEETPANEDYPAAGDEGVGADAGRVEAEEQQDGDGDQDEDEDEGQQLMLPPRTELEELANRRSFNELQSDSSERDKDGHVVVSKRRHLINGRPVVARRAAHSDDEAAEGEGEDEAPDRELAVAAPDVDRGQASEEDFERLVREIDQEDRLKKQAAAAAEVSRVPGAPPLDKRRDAPAKSKPRGVSVAQSQQHNTTLSPSGQSVAPGAQASARAARLPSGGAQDKDSHEHSLQESLTSQQWDDDSATSGGNSAATAAEAPEISDDEDEDEVSNIVERDAEARRLERMSRELLLNPARVSRELDREQERRRRRRKRDAATESSLVGSAGELPAHGGEVATTHSDASGRWQRADSTARAKFELPGAADERQTGRPAGGPAALLEPSVGSAGLEGAARVPGAGESSTEKSTQVGAGGSSLPVNAHRNDWPQSGGRAGHHSRAAPLATNEGPSLPPSDDPRAGQLSGLEDMHVEVLADPTSPAGGPAGPLGPQAWPPASYGPLYTPTMAAAEPPLRGHAHQASPQVASGSHKVAAKKVKKKKVAKKKLRKAGKSKKVDSKYKAARAYARKHASRLKKGDMRKKRRKSAKRLVAQRKHFKGSTQGNKSARGAGAQGAKKGAVLYKDKGYKKRGFKKAYHKLETGDHKTYFDEFRDKDHKRKWKNFDDKHKYSQRKKWAGHDAKHLDTHHLKLAKGRTSKAGRWRESAANKHLREMDKFKKSSSRAGEAKLKKVVKKKKQKKKVDK